MNHYKKKKTQAVPICLPWATWQKCTAVQRSSQLSGRYQICTKTGQRQKLQHWHKLLPSGHVNSAILSNLPSLSWLAQNAKMVEFDQHSGFWRSLNNASYCDFLWHKQQFWKPTTGPAMTHRNFGTISHISTNSIRQFSAQFFEYHWNLDKLKKKKN